MRIEFKGDPYLFVGKGSLEEGGPICTPEQFENGWCSFAHLFPDGVVRQFGAEIGRREDIVIVDAEAPLPEPPDLVKALFNTVFGDWSKPEGE